MEGTKPDLTSRINAHFDENPDLGAHERFIGLFGRRGQAPIDDNAASTSSDTVTAILPPPQRRRLDTTTNAALSTSQALNTLHPLVAMQHAAVPPYTLGSPMSYSYSTFLSYYMNRTRGT